MNQVDFGSDALPDAVSAPSSTMSRYAVSIFSGEEGTKATAVSVIHRMVPGTAALVSRSASVVWAATEPWSIGTLNVMVKTSVGPM